MNNKEKEEREKNRRGEILGRHLDGLAGRQSDDPQVNPAQHHHPRDIVHRVGGGGTVAHVQRADGEE